MYHVPVMLKECLDGLNIDPNGIYVDVTFGGGGHSRAILEQLEGGKLYAFDQDADAVKNAEGLDPDKFTLIEANFRHLKRYLRLHGVKKVDGILADLGVSSYQIDTAERGFSTRKNGELDMRMNTSDGLSAKELLATYDEEAIARVFWLYGELRNSRQIARSLVGERGIDRMNDTADLVKALSKFAPRGKENQFYAKIFQALRIEVNDEMGALQDFLLQSAEVLKEEGRLVIMSYHSLEDRLVKNFMKSGNFEGEIAKDFFGNQLKNFDLVNRKPIMAGAEELGRNSRARSAKLRVASYKEISNNEQQLP